MKRISRRTMYKYDELPLNNHGIIKRGKGGWTHVELIKNTNALLHIWTRQNKDEHWFLIEARRTRKFPNAKTAPCMNLALMVCNWSSESSFSKMKFKVTIYLEIKKKNHHMFFKVNCNISFNFSYSCWKKDMLQNKKAQRLRDSFLTKTVWMQWNLLLSLSSLRSSTLRCVNNLTFCDLT